MSEPVFQINIAARRSKRFDAVPLASMGFKERKDLQEWIVAHPDLLGERLLVVTTEFHGFDTSSRRLDILAIDEQGVLVVVELKLDARGTHADLQALRYASMCSTMSMDDVVRLFASTHALGDDEARERVRTFLDVDELPELGDRPRIILAAGSLDDAELTGTVLWLREFGVDIRCVELAPYDLGESGGGLILVPRTIIPLPEAGNYIVRVEQKKAKAATTRTRMTAIRAQLAAIREAYLSRYPDKKMGAVTVDGKLRILTGQSFNYQWNFSRGSDAVAIELRINTKAPEQVAQIRVSLLQDLIEVIEGGLGHQSHEEVRMTGRQQRVGFCLPVEGEPEAFANRAVDAMEALIAGTEALVMAHLDGGK